MNDRPTAPLAERRHASRNELRRTALILFGGFFLTLIWIVMMFRRPAVVSATAGPEQFSAERAFQHLPPIASQPRPIGSPGHEQTRDYLLAELQRLGLKPEIQQATSLLRFEGSPGFSAGSVQNVIVRIPGSDPTGAIALDAHYDGAATGPAAGDCGSGVVVLLETIRAVLGGEPLKNDLLFVFADAEEVGDLGAHAFASQHPWMRDVRLALNYEAMGAGGPAFLYATSEDNYQLIKDYAQAYPSTLTNSFTTGIFGLFPGMRLACDLQDYMDEGAAGLGFVFTGNISAYHTRLDNIESLERATVQQLGETTLDLVRYFGQTDLSALKKDRPGVFFSLWPGTLIRYPASASLPLALLVLLVLLLSVGFNVRKKNLAAGKVIAAAGVLLTGILLATILSVGVWFSIKALNGNLGAFLVGNWAVNWFLAGILIFAVTAMTTLVVTLCTRISFLEQFAGVLLVFSLLATLLGVIYPVGSYLFLWPAGVGAVVLLGLTYGRDRTGNTWPKALLALTLAIPAILLTAPIMTGPNPFVGLLIRLDALTGMPLLAVDAFFAAALTGLLAPLLAAVISREENLAVRFWRRALALGFATSMLLFAVGWMNSGFDATHPHPESIRYELDADRGTAHWVTGDHRLGPWTNQFIPENTKPVEANNPSLLAEYPTTFAASAPVVSLLPPTAEVLEDQMEAGVRTLRLRLRTPRGASMLRVRIDAGRPVLAAWLEGQTFSLNDYAMAREGQLWLNYAACPPEGIELRLQLEGAGPVNLSLVDLKDGLPPGVGVTASDRPKATMPSPLAADCTVVGMEVEI